MCPAWASLFTNRCLPLRWWSARCPACIRRGQLVSTSQRVEGPCVVWGAEHFSIVLRLCKKAPLLAAVFVSQFLMKAGLLCTAGCSVPLCLKLHGLLARQLPEIKPSQGQRMLDSETSRPCFQVPFSHWCGRLNFTHLPCNPRPKPPIGPLIHKDR